MKKHATELLVASMLGLFLLAPVYEQDASAQPTLTLAYIYPGDSLPALPVQSREAILCSTGRPGRLGIQSVFFWSFQWLAPGRLN